jgi:hypothetical protein
VHVPPKQLPVGHVVPSVLLVAPTHKPEAGVHVPGLRQLPACAVQLTLFATHRSAGNKRLHVIFKNHLALLDVPTSALNTLAARAA